MSTDATYPNRYYQARPYLAGAMVMGIVLCFVGFDSSNFVAFSAPIFLAMFAFAGLLGCWITGWSLEQSLRFFRDGNALGRWGVEGAQWLDFARARRQKMAARARWAVGLLVLALLVAVPFAYDDSLLLWLFVGVFGGMAVFLIVLLRFVVHRPYAPGIHRALIEVGPGVALINGHILPFAGFGLQLTGVEIDEDRQLLIISGRGQANESSMPFEHELPYPAEAKEEVVRAMAGLGYGYGLSPVEAE